MAQALLGEATRERLKSASQCTPTQTKNRLADTLKGVCASQTCSKPKAFTLSAIALSLSAAMQNRPHGPIIQNCATKGHLGLLPPFPPNWVHQSDILQIPEGGVVEARVVLDLLLSRLLLSKLTL